MYVYPSDTRSIYKYNSPKQTSDSIACHNTIPFQRTIIFIPFYMRQWLQSHEFILITLIKSEYYLSNIWNA